MVLPDTSAWIEYLRATGSVVDDGMAARLERGDELATTDVVLMEVLAGARSDQERDELAALLARCRYLRTDAPGDYEAAAELYRSCRANGATVRKMTDCLIASVAIRHGVPVFHDDLDFVVIARASTLQLA